jgi:hypothetical protein
MTVGSGVPEIVGGAFPAKEPSELQPVVSEPPDWQPASVSRMTADASFAPRPATEELDVAAVGGRERAKRDAWVGSTVGGCPHSLKP